MKITDIEKQARGYIIDKGVIPEPKDFPIVTIFASTAVGYLLGYFTCMMF